MELNYKVFGEGQPLIILHGLFGSLDNWQTFARKWSQDYMVFIVDQRNHGKSPHEPEIDYELLAEDLKEFMEQQFVHHAHLLGHSMGGKTVMQFALEYPDMVDKLIVADMSPSTYPPGHDEIFQALFDARVENAESRKEVEERLSRGIDDNGVRQFLLKGLYREDGKNFAWKFNLDALFNNYNEILEGLDADHPYEKPCLFLKGEKSGYVGPKQQADIDRLFPNAIIESVEAGHWLHAENPVDFSKKVEDYLKS